MTKKRMNTVIGITILIIGILHFMNVSFGNLDNIIDIILIVCGILLIIR